MTKNLPVDLQLIKNLNGVSLTQREVDILSCLLSGKSNKSIAFFLIMSHRTVGTHLRSLMGKFECNSREDLIHIAEQSPHFLVFKKHYIGLLIESHFKRFLQELTKLLHGRRPDCLIVPSSFPIEQKLIKKLESHLSLANFRTKLLDSSDYSALNETTGAISTQPVDGIICFLTNYGDERLRSVLLKKVSEKPGSIICLTQDSNQELDKGETSQVVFLSLGNGSSYYEMVLKVLKQLLPTLSSNLDQLFSSFTKQVETLSGNEGPLNHQREPIVPTNRSSWLSYQFGYMVTIGGGIASVLALVFSLWTHFQSNSKEDAQTNSKVISIRSELPLPQEQTYLDRLDLLKQIDDNYKSQKTDIRIVALVGPGGAGKTTLARHYARTQKYPVVWELNAETRSTLVTSLFDLAHILAQTPQKQSELELIKKTQDFAEKEKHLVLFIKENLRVKAPWFLIYDNVENLSNIKDFFPQDSQVWGSGKVILSTRDQNIKNTTYVNPSNIIPIHEFTETDALILVSKILYNQKPNKLEEDVKKKIGDFLSQIPLFPLDVFIAASYIKNTQISFDQYLDRIQRLTKEFDKTQESLLKSVNHYAKTRYGIISVSLKEMIQVNPEFKELLLLICLLDSQNIPKSFLESFKETSVIEQFLYNLRKHGLITNESFSKNNRAIHTFSLHRSTQDMGLIFLKTLFSPTASKQFFGIIADVFRNYVDGIISKEDLFNMKVIESHCEKFLKHNELFLPFVKLHIKIDLGCILLYLNNYQKAQKIFEETLVEIKSSHSTDYYNIARILMYLGIVHRENGNYERAMEFLEEALLLYNNHSLHNNFDLSFIYAYLGNIYRDVGNYKKAREFLERSFFIYEKCDPEDVRVTNTLNILGNAYKVLGDYDKAKLLLEKSLVLYKKSTPKNYLGKIRVLTNLGNTYVAVGDYKKAEEFLNESLALLKEHFPENKFDLAWSLLYLANIYTEIGNYQKAKDLLEQSFVIFKTDYSDNLRLHRFLFGYLGIVHREMGNYEKAKEFLEQSRAIFKTYYPKNYVGCAWVSIHLGNVYKHLGQYEEAKNYFKESLEVYEKSFGKMHIKTARVLRSLGQVYVLENQFETAEELISTSLKIFQQHKHPESYTALESLAELYLRRYEAGISSKQNKQQLENLNKQAIQYLSKTLDAAKLSLPSNSPHLKRIQLKLELYNNSRKWVF